MTHEEMLEEAARREAANKTLDEMTREERVNAGLEELGYVVMEGQMTLEEIEKFLDDNNTTLEEYLRENMITDEERKEFDQKWNALMVETLYRKFEDTSQTGTGDPQNPL